MNDSPCPICNFLALKRRQAFIKREYAELERYEQEHETHRVKCEIINGGWYLGLWRNAIMKAPAGSSTAEAVTNAE